MKFRRYMFGGALIVASLTAGVVPAFAANSSRAPASAQPAGDVHACVKPDGGMDFLQFRPENYGKCHTGDAAWMWARTSGTAAKQVTLSSSNTDLADNVTVPTGGSFVTNSVELGNGLTLQDGTYIITVNAKVTPAHAYTAQVFPQLFMYSQAKNSAFEGDVLNLGNGAFETGVNHNVDEYLSGVTTVTVKSPTTYHFYGFGYGSDTGSDSYTLDNLDVQVLTVK